MTIEKLNYLLTGTEQPRGVTEREKTIIAECAKIITDIEQNSHKHGVMQAEGSDGAEGTFGVCVGLPCMCAKVRGWPLCQRKAIRLQPNAL